MTDTPEHPKEPPPETPVERPASEEHLTAEPERDEVQEALAEPEVDPVQEAGAEPFVEEEGLIEASEPVEEPPAPPPPPPEPPQVQAAPPPPLRVDPAPPPQTLPAPPAPQGLPWVPIAIIAGIIVALLVGAYALRGLGGGGEQQTTYVVQPYTPTTELITGRDRVEARADPDLGSRVVVIFGQGVTLNVSGRVQHGLGNDWYAINWNNQTAFVRAQDAIAGSGAPPAPIVRERQPEEEEKEEEKPEDELAEEEEQVAETPRGGALGAGDVNWVREPSARDFARYFPDEALDEGQSGNVTLSCIIGGSGRLACSVASESPSGYGFGNAAIGISRQLRVRTTLPDGSSAEGREVRLPLSFRAN